MDKKEPATRLYAQHTTEEELSRMIVSTLVEVLCGNCGCGLGQFIAEDDHGGVMVKCPSCGDMNYIYNYLLWQSEEHEAYRQ